MELLQTRTDIGLVRENNEDVVLALSHPKNKAIKLLLAADGMGGREKGEIASTFIASSIQDWFLKKDSKTLNDTEKLENLLGKYIKTLNTKFIKKNGQDKMGTTLILAIVNKSHTLIANVGDSRAYIYQKKDLIQISEDASNVWSYYKHGKVRKDDLRYFASNSIVTSCIGIYPELCRISFTKLENDYDMIFLLTDGVTDNITDKKIKRLIHKVSPKYLLSSLIYEAVYVDQHLHIPRYLKKKYTENYVVPFPGRDNASGCIYIPEK